MSIRPLYRPAAADVMYVSPVDVVMIQCWLFGLELCAGADFGRFLELLEDWPATYRPRAAA